MRRERRERREREGREERDIEERSEGREMREEREERDVRCTQSAGCAAGGFPSTWGWEVRLGCLCVVAGLDWHCH